MEREGKQNTVFYFAFKIKERLNFCADKFLFEGGDFLAGKYLKMIKLIATKKMSNQYPL